MYSPAQIKALLITPMFTGSLSTAASGTLITALLRSETKLTVPSKRILFGLCVYDCFMSIASALSSIPIPSTQDVWGASGNVHTCNFQGFIAHVGYVGSALYNCNLSIYYLCVIRFSMSDATFRKKVEPICHFIPNLYAFGGAIYLLVKGYFNNVGNLCWVGPSPINCINNPEVECLRGGEDAYNLRWFFLGYAVYVVWAVIIITMISIVVMVLTQRRRSESWASGGRKSTTSTSSLRMRDNEGGVENQATVSSRTGFTKSTQEYKDPLVFDLKAMRTKTRRQSLIAKTPDATMDETNPFTRSYSDPHSFDVKTARAAMRTSILSSSEKEVSSENSENSPVERVSLNKMTISNTPSVSVPKGNNSSRLSLGSAGRRSIGSRSDSGKRGPSLNDASREVKIQALLYISSFVVCWIFSIINRILEQNDKQTPFIIWELARIFNPIQGLFNVLVYCRPHVSGLRSHHPEYSWWKAFCLTVMSGGDNNTSRVNRSLAHTKPKKEVLDKIRQNHTEMMANIRRSKRSSIFDSSLRSSNQSNGMNDKSSPGTKERKENISLDLDTVSESVPVHNDHSPCDTNKNDDTSLDKGEMDLELGNDMAATNDE